MTRPVYWSDLAVQQLAGITFYIGRTSPLYAERMTERILRRVATLMDFPDIGLRVSEAEDDSVREVLENPYAYFISRSLPAWISRHRPRASGYFVAEVTRRLSSDVR